MNNLSKIKQNKNNKVDVVDLLKLFSENFFSSVGDLKTFNDKISKILNNVDGEDCILGVSEEGRGFTDIFKNYIDAITRLKGKNDDGIYASKQLDLFIKSSIENNFFKKLFILDKPIKYIVEETDLGTNKGIFDSKIDSINVTGFFIDYDDFKYKKGLYDNNIYVECNVTTKDGDTFDVKGVSIKNLSSIIYRNCIHNSLYTYNSNNNKEKVRVHVASHLLEKFEDIAKKYLFNLALNSLKNIEYISNIESYQTESTIITNISLNKYFILDNTYKYYIKLLQDLGGTPVSKEKFFSEIYEGIKNIHVISWFDIREKAIGNFIQKLMEQSNIKKEDADMIYKKLDEFLLAQEAIYNTYVETLLNDGISIKDFSSELLNGSSLYSYTFVGFDNITEMQGSRPSKFVDVEVHSSLNSGYSKKGSSVGRYNIVFKDIEYEKNNNNEYYIGFQNINNLTKIHSKEYRFQFRDKKGKEILDKCKVTSYNNSLNNFIKDLEYGFNEKFIEKILGTGYSESERKDLIKKIKKITNTPIENGGLLATKNSYKTYLVIEDDSKNDDGSSAREDNVRYIRTFFKNIPTILNKKDANDPEYLKKTDEFLNNNVSKFRIIKAMNISPLEISIEKTLISMLDKDRNPQIYVNKNNKITIKY